MNRRAILGAIVAVGLAAPTIARPVDHGGGLVRRTIVLGRSVDGSPLRAVELGDPRSPHRALVVGCIHGNEGAGIAIVRRLATGAVPRSVDLWLIPDLNPDGFAAQSRGNAHGVDLNRNFGWRWRASSAGVFYSGPRPLSEPESRAAVRLIERLRPRVTIWFHQHERTVDDSEGNRRIERRFARLVGLPLRPLAVYPGSATSWENHVFRGTSAFVVELPSGRLDSRAIARYARAVLAATG